MSVKKCFAASNLVNFFPLKIFRETPFPGPNRKTFKSSISSIASISIHFFSLGLVMLLFFLLSSIHSYVLFLLFPSFASSLSHYEVSSLACAKCDNTIWALLHNLNGYILSHVQMKKSKLFLHILLFSTLFNSWVIG